MAATEGLTVYDLAWGDKSGYVSLSLRDPTLTQQDNGYWVDRFFKWPDDRDKVESFIERERSGPRDLYFAPVVFKTARRDETKTVKLDTLYADLDEVNPDQLPRHLQPTASWETSPDRYQAMWSLNTTISPRAHRELNQRLTYAIGADKGGWGLTKVLRVPGAINHKYEANPEVKMHHLNGKVLNAVKVLKDLPEVSVSRVKHNGQAPELPDVKDVLRRKKIPARAQRILSSKNIVAHTRSDRLWELECLLAESGLNAEEIVALVRPTAWNKYLGRADEMRRLFTEAEKALDHAGVVTIKAEPHEDNEPDDEFEEDAPIEPRTWLDFDLQRKPITWLVSDIWGEGEVGFISGPPKTFKSWIALDLAISIATGDKFLGQFPCKRTNVLLIQEEDPQSILQTRLAQIGGNKGLIYAEPSKNNVLDMRYELPDNLYLLSNSGFVVEEDWLATLAQWVHERDIGFIIMDPLSMIAGEVDEFKMFDLMSKLLKPLKRLRTETQAAICIIHHHTKNDTGKTGGASMYGSVAFWAWEEAALHLSLVGLTRVTIERFSKHAQLSPITVEMGDTTHRWDPQLSKGNHGSIEDLLTSMEGATVEELVSYTGLGRDAVTRHLKKHQIEGEVYTDKNLRRDGPGRPAVVYRWVKTDD